jgi:hypothetical protein
MFKVWLRNKYISIFKKKILLIEKNNKITDNKITIKLINIFYLLNLKRLLKYNNYNILYKIDDLIFYDDTIIDNIIHEIILYVELVEESIDVTSNVQKYSLNTPIYIIVKLEKYNTEGTIKFRTLNGEMEHKIADIMYQKLYEIIV